MRRDAASFPALIREYAHPEKAPVQMPVMTRHTMQCELKIPRREREGRKENAPAMSPFSSAC